MLWALALLAMLGSTITAAGRSETRIAGNLAAAANAEAAADGAISVAAFHLLDGSDQHWEPRATPRELTIGDSAVSIALLDQRGKIDPNDATAGLMTALLRQIGVSGQTALDVGAAITAWRIANDNGEIGAYQAARRRYAPPHEPFQSIDEIALVQGVTPTLLARMAPHLSLFVEQQPQLAHAGPEVTAAVAEAVKRDQLTLNADQSPGPLIVQVVATARNHGAVFVRSALLRMNGIANQPYEVLEWVQGR